MRDTLVDLVHETRVNVPQIGTELDVVHMRPEVDGCGVWPATKDLCVRNAAFRIARRNIALGITREPHLSEWLLVTAYGVVQKVIALPHIARKLIAREESVREPQKTARKEALNSDRATRRRMPSGSSCGS